MPSKCRKCRFRDPNFKKFPGDPLQLHHHYGLPLTKILATPLGKGVVCLLSMVSRPLSAYTTNNRNCKLNCNRNCKQ